MTGAIEAGRQAVDLDHHAARTRAGVQWEHIDPPGRRCPSEIPPRESNISVRVSRITAQPRLLPKLESAMFSEATKIRSRSKTSVLGVQNSHNAGTESPNRIVQTSAPESCR